MADFNRCFLIGRLVADPELRTTPNGASVCTMRLVTNRRYAGKDGQQVEETLFIDISAWNRQAETCSQYLRKGSSVHVEGHLKQDTWDDRSTGEKRSKIKVEADRVTFLDSRPSAERDDGAVAPPRRPVMTPPDEDTPY